jgi:tetratricopeptide (TPR) repeat protein
MKTEALRTFESLSEDNPSGDQVMMFTRRPILTALAPLSFVLIIASSLFAQPAKEDESLRKRVLSLNDVTGDDAIRGEIRALSDKPADAKKLVGLGVKIAKEKKQPLNYNGAFILASVALGLKDLEASEVLYQICADQAAQLRSPHKLVKAYSGIAAVGDSYWRDNKFEKSARFWQRFLETMERHGARGDLKDQVLRRLIQSMFKQGETDKATRMIDSLIKEGGSDWRNLKLKAWLEMEKGHLEEAIKVYQDMIGPIGQDKRLKANEKADEQKQIYVTILALIEQLYSDKKYEQCEKLSQRLLDTLEKQAGPQQIKDMVMRLTIRSMIGHGQTDKAKQMVDNLMKHGGADWRNLKIKAWLFYESGRYDEAAKTYEEVLQRLTYDSAIDPDDRTDEQKIVRSILSTVYMDLNQVDKATDALKALLKQYPNDPGFNNDLGYIWADHDKNLDEAERMIRKALDEDRKQRKADTTLKPEDDKDKAAYLDSLGWVLFKKKQYQDAKKYFTQAIQDKEGQHIEILDHLGDTHFILGEKTDAIAVWKRALQIKASTKREEQKKTEVERKIEKATPVAPTPSPTGKDRNRPQPPLPKKVDIPDKKAQSSK